MGLLSWKNPYTNLEIKLFDPDIFKEDEKHSGKECIGTAHILYMLARTQSMFIYEGLPETIPARNLEIMLQLNGNVFFTEVDGKYYVFTGGLGGEPDVYYEPTIYTVANPALKFSANLKIGEDGILIRSDSYGIGLLPMMQKYAALMVENDFTMRIADINARISFLISAADDRTEKSARVFLERVADGELGIVSDSAFLDSLKVNPTGSEHSQRLTDLIEYQQYLKAAWFNDLGINANYNMKREAISPDEAQLNDDVLLPLIDDMIDSRRKALDEINKKYGLDIKVDFDSSWLKEQVSQDPELSPISNMDEVAEDLPSPATPQEEQEPEIIEEPEESQEPEEESQEPEEIIEEVKEELKDIKETLEEIKEEVSDEESGDDNQA